MRDELNASLLSGEVNNRLFNCLDSERYIRDRLRFDVSGVCSRYFRFCFVYMDGQPGVLLLFLVVSSFFLFCWFLGLFPYISLCIFFFLLLYFLFSSFFLFIYVCVISVLFCYSCWCAEFSCLLLFSKFVVDVVFVVFALAFVSVLELNQLFTLCSFIVCMVIVVLLLLLFG